MAGKTRGAFAAAFSLLVLALPAFAHHSASAEFDFQRQVSVRGEITKIDWSNPHVYIWLNVKNAKGKTEGWSFESTTPRALRTAGITRKDFAIGQTITISGILAKDHTRNFGWLKQVSFRDGHTVTMWPASENSKFKESER